MKRRERTVLRGRCGATLADLRRILLLACAICASSVISLRAQDNTVYQAVFDRHEYFLTYEPSSGSCGRQSPAKITTQSDITVSESLPCTSGATLSGTINLPRPGNFSGVVANSSFFHASSPIQALLSAKVTLTAGNQDFGTFGINGGVCETTRSDRGGLFANTSATREISSSCMKEFLEITRVPAPGVHDGEVVITSGANIFSTVFQPLEDYNDGYSVRTYYKLVAKGNPTPTPTPGPTPNVTGLAQKYIGAGSTIKITIHGNNFGPDAQPEFVFSDGALNAGEVDPALVVSAVNVVSSTEIQALLSANGTDSNGPRKLRVRSAGGVANFPDALEVFEVTMHLSQGDNTGEASARVANHPTVVRAYVATTSTLSSSQHLARGAPVSSGAGPGVSSPEGPPNLASGFRGLLYVFDGETQVPGSPFIPNPPREPGTNSDLLFPEKFADNDDLFFLRNTLNFYFGLGASLPSHDAIGDGRHSFILAVSPTNPTTPPVRRSDLSKAALKANHDFIVLDRMPQQNFVTTRQFRVYVIVDPRLSTERANGTFNFHGRDFEYLAAAYPIDNSRAKLDIRRGLGETLDIDALKPLPGEKTKWANKVLDRMNELIVSLNTGRPAEQQFDKIVLMLESRQLSELTAADFGAINGLGNYGGRACLYGGFSPPTLAHELGHTLGLWDTYIAAANKRSVPNPRRDDAVDDGNQVEHGTERLASLHTPSNFHPVVVASTRAVGEGLPNVSYQLISLMGAGRPDRWPDIKEWKHLFANFQLTGGAKGAIKSFAGLAGTAPLEQVHVQGFIDVTDQVTVTSVRRAVLPTSTSEPGDYALELLNGAGQVLAATAFGVDFLMPDIGLVEEAFFSLDVPYAAGARVVRIRRGDKVLFSRPISANAPTVKILTPAGGDTIGGPFTISWTGSDADGGALTYSITYVRGDGTPVLIADRLTSTSFKWNNPTLGGGSNAGHLVVRASDGVNEGSANSAVFSVSRRGPSVTITHPQNGAGVAAGKPTRISGAGSDAEDGYLPAAALSFRSSIDGALGSGTTVSPTLTPGTHTITLRGIDSDGKAAESSITLIVAAATTVPAVESVSPRAARTGTAVTLNGHNFAGGATVSFGATAASVVSVSANKIVVMVPAGLPLGEVEVFVTSGGQKANSILLDIIYGRPFLARVTPERGPPGTPVFLAGAEFATTSGGNTVHFGNATATVLSAGLDGLFVSVPPGINPGGTNVTVTTSQGASDPLPFTVTSGEPASRVVVNSISPSSGNAGKLITISGKGFSTVRSRNVVAFGGITTTPVNATTNTLQVNVPFGLATGNLIVWVSVDGYPSNPRPFTVTSGANPSPTPIGQPGCTPAPANLVSFWRAEGNAKDATGGNNGTLTAGLAFAPGKVGQAFNLDGVDDFVSFGNPSNLQLTTALTAEAWIRPDTTYGNYRTVVSKWSQSSQHSWGLFVTDNRVYGIVANASDQFTDAVGGTIPFGTTAAFTHVAMTYGATEGIKVYVNGVLVNSDAAIGNIKTGTDLVRIGNDTDLIGDRYFDGLIDEASVYNRVLSAAEIQGIFNAGTKGKCSSGNASPTPAPKREVQNISTRLLVGTGENVAIGGFIVQGTGPKPVIVRAIGPSLANFGVEGALADPALELFDGSGNPVEANDDWESSVQNQEIAALLPPSDGVEAAIIATLTPGNYTAVLKGYQNGTGIALVEVYDLDQGAPSRLANISTRGQVGTGGAVLIGGFIVGKQAQFVVRAIGPFLGTVGIANALGNPVLELYNAQGVKFDTNDNWQDNPSAGQVSNLGLAPNNPLESALIRTLVPGNYTAIVRGSGGTTGVGLVEVYSLQ